MFDDVATLLADRATSVTGDGGEALSDADLLACGEQLTALGRRVDALRASVVAAVDARGASDVELGLRTSAWLSHSTRESKRSAHRAVRVGRGCRRLPLAAAAWSDGRLSVDHVEVLSRAVANPRVRDQIVGLQALLIDHAAEVPFETWRLDVLGIVDRLDADGGFEPGPDSSPSVLRLLPLFDGTFQLHADLSAADHATVSAALEAEADALFRRYTHDHEVSGGEVEIPSRAQLMAEALVSLCRKGSAVDLESTAPLRPEAVIVIREPEAGAAGAVAEVEGAAMPVPVNFLDSLLPAADWRRIVIDAKGEVLDLGRKERLANRAQRRALHVRDGGCIFPGCTAPAHWCDIHHLIKWLDGGRTDLDNLVLLCRYHHGVIHREGWRWTRRRDGRIEWTTPSGRTIVSQRHRRMAVVETDQPPAPSAEAPPADPKPTAPPAPFGPGPSRRWYPPTVDPASIADSAPAPPMGVVA